MEDSKPPGLWLWSDGFPHGPIWATTSFSSNGLMFLEKGWKTFIRSRSHKKRDNIVFKYDGDESFWARCFDFDGDHMEYCVESSNSSDSEFYNGENASTDDRGVSSNDDEA